MKLNERRLNALEHTFGMKGGWDHTKPTHVIIMDEGAPYGEALAEYRRKNPDKAIGPDDNAIWIRLVSPQHDDEGRMIPRTPPKGPSDHEGPTLADVMNGVVQ
jgi:hypothetical protein